MRILVMFDLPVTTKPLRKVHADFRRYLLQNGFDMIQYSIYSRYCSNYDSASKQINRLSAVSPKKGSVRYMIITEKQYAEMGIITGKITHQETINNGSQLVFF